MSELTAEEFAQRAKDFDLLSERQVQEAWNQAGRRDISGDEFRQLLLRRDLLTNYQVERLARGERTGFFYGAYKVMYLVGSGSFARVYRAVHRESGQIVAVKVLRSRFSQDPVQTQSFCREGELVAELRHPNIVSIFEVYSKGDTHFLAMDFIEGRNLREFIKIRKKFDPAEATRLIIDVTGGLAYAFNRGVHHRDLKMSNILLSSRGQAKLVDFGLAGGADTEEDEEATVNPRTIDYAALERGTGVPRDDPRSDIYFLGGIYYNLLTGKPALQETKDRIQRLSRTRFESVVPILEADPSIPRSIAAIVNKAMELDAQMRYQSPAEMFADLKTAADRLGDPEETAASDALPPGYVAPPPKPSSTKQQRVLMFVESNPELQDIFRQKLKTSGYRVLVTQDPDRALARFNEDPKTADCAIFSTGVIGESALKAFNQFGDNPKTRDLPAVLLLGEGQLAWKKRAHLNDHRVCISMPIKLRELRTLLAKLVPTAALSEKD